MKSFNIFSKLNQGQTTTTPAATRASVSTTETGTTPMLVEMGPEIVSVSSVTAQIITESEGATPSTSTGNTGMFWTRSLYCNMGLVIPHKI